MPPIVGSTGCVPDKSWTMGVLHQASSIARVKLLTPQLLRLAYEAS